MKGIKGSATHLKLRPVFKGHLISHLEKKERKKEKIFIGLILVYVLEIK